MHGRRALLVVVAVAIGAAVAWWLQRDPAIAPSRDEPARAPHAAAPANANVSGDGASTEPRREDGAPAPVADGNAATKELQLRVRLRGLHPKAQWTTPLTLRLKGRDEPRDQWLSFDAAAAPDADGRATFVVPDWCAGASQQKGWLEARDPNYQRVQHRWDAAPDLAHELVVDVQVVGVLTGRVVDPEGRAVAAARVVAFALRNGEPVEPALASTNTHEDGSYRLPVPPEVSLWLVAAPMQPAVGRQVTTEDGGVPDRGFLRIDLLPAATTTTARTGQPTTVADLVLAPAARITGSVKWADGAAIPGAFLRTLPAGGTRLAFDQTASVQRTPDGALAPGTITDTGFRGEFQLPACVGVATDVEVFQIHDTLLFGTFRVRATPPQRIDFTLPRPVILRTTDGERPVANARLDIKDSSALATGNDGTLWIVLAQPLRVRGARERLRSPWIDVPLAAAGTTIDIAMTNQRVPVSIEFDGDFRVRNTIITWRRDDGVEESRHLMRDDRPGAFQVFLEPGTYHLSAGPGGGERNGYFLLPSERDVEVGAEPLSLRLPALFGGTFTVMATDSSGLYVAGTCELHDRAGADLTAGFRLENGTTGRAGELIGGGANLFSRVLAPGDYELMCDFGVHGAHRAIVTIKPRETTEVRIRLP